MYEKLLGIKNDTKLNFNKHLNDIINKASRKVNVLSIAMHYMSLPKKQKLVNSCFNSQSNCCPLIWLFLSCIVNNKITHQHERCLRLFYVDKLSSFEKLLELDKSVTIHTRNLQIFSKYIEIYLHPFLVRLFIDVIKIMIYKSIQSLPNVRSSWEKSLGLKWHSYDNSFGKKAPRWWVLTWKK